MRKRGQAKAWNPNSAQTLTVDPFRLQGREFDALSRKRRGQTTWAGRGTTVAEFFCDGVFMKARVYLLVVGAMFLGGLSARAEVDPLARWREGVTVKAVSGTEGRHTTHSYYLTTPESPDGTRVLYFSSTAANGEFGDICVVDRATGKETIVARGGTCEDAHRVACQQWTLGGKAVAFHDVRDKRWGVYMVDLESGKEKTIALDRQVGFGQGAGHLVPVYGPHWKPGEHRGLEIADAATGEVRERMKIEVMEEAYKAWLEKEFKGKPVSVFFPIVSKDEKRVFFKVASSLGGEDFRSKNASLRQGIVAYDLEQNGLLFMRERWGHPAWFPDSRRIIEIGNISFDSSEKGKFFS